MDYKTNDCYFYTSLISSSTLDLTFENASQIFFKRHVGWKELF